MIYQWNYSVRLDVNYDGNNAEVHIQLGRQYISKVVRENCASLDEAEDSAQAFCEELHKKIEALVTQEVAHLKNVIV